MITKNITEQIKNKTNTICIDIDRCIAQNNKTISNGALKLINQFDSYTEFSQSSMGIHIYITADWNEIIQFYDMLEVPHPMNSSGDENPCFTIHRTVDTRCITEKTYTNASDEIADCTDELKNVLAQYTEYYRTHPKAALTQRKSNSENVSQIAEYIRKNEHYCFVNKNSEGEKAWYLYHNGSYKAATVSEFKAMIKSYIKPDKYTPELIDDVYNELSIEPVDSPHKFEIEQFNTDENKISFKNGVWNLDARTLSDHSPQLLTTNQINADCKCISDCVNNGVFNKLMQDCFDGDKSQIKLMLQIIGLALSNIDTSKVGQAVFTVDESGKFAVMLKKLVSKMIGNSACTSVNLKRLKSHVGASELYFKRLTGDNDIKAIGEKELDVFRCLTNGESPDTNDLINLPFRGLLWFCCNKMPTLQFNGTWFFERAVILHLKKVSVSHDLYDSLWNERDYIAALALNALDEFISNGFRFTVAQKNIDYLNEYKTETCSTIRFFNECCEPCDNNSQRLSTSDMYNAYQRWYSSDTDRPCKESKENFKAVLKSMGKDKTVKVNGTYYYSDFTLRERGFLNA